MNAPLPSVTVFALLAPVTASASLTEDVLLASLLDNADFAQEPPSFTDARGVRRIPWWRSSSGAELLGTDGDRTVLATAPGEWAEQPVAAYSPLIGGLVIGGEVRGRGRLVVVDGAGGRVEVTLGSDDGWTSFELTHADLAAQLGRSLVPRCLLRLEAGGERGALWTGLSARVPLPLPTQTELRAEILQELAWIFELWLEHGLDEVGEEPTAFLTHLFDVVTGEHLDPPLAGGHNVLYQSLADALEVEEVPEWRAAYERFLDDWLERCWHRKTGLPQSWNTARDVANGDQYVEVAIAIGALIDLALEGNEARRARALEILQRAGETILARGVLPDGEVCAKYRSSDGLPNTSYVHLRRLNLVAQLERLARLTGDERYRVAVRDAFANFEYSHGWPGDWEEIDPGFDDIYGNFGSRALLMWRTTPEEDFFRRLVVGGYEYYAPRWEDALRLGGNVAADQVRCWKIVAGLAELEPATRPGIARLLRLAARSHFKGLQYGNGAWGDVSVYAFRPKADLQVGDIKGTPQNLLQGLASIYDPALAAEPDGPQLDELRAMFTAVMRSSRERYRREYGYLTTRREMKGVNASGGSLRLAVGLVEMLKRL